MKKEFSKIQKEAIKKVLLEDFLNLVVLEEKEVEKISDNLIKLGSTKLKDNSTTLHLLMIRNTQQRVVKMRVNDKDFFIVSSRYQVIS
jgi:hypothetical protein